LVKGRRKFFLLPTKHYPDLGGEGEDDVIRWDSRVGEENRETAGANYVLRIKIVLLHPNNLI
jgi:hypothetical protein